MLKWKFAEYNTRQTDRTLKLKSEKKIKEKKSRQKEKEEDQIIFKNEIYGKNLKKPISDRGPTWSCDDRFASLYTLNIVNNYN